MDEQQLQQQIVQLVQAAKSGNQQAAQQIQQIMQAAQQGDQQAIQIAQMIQQVAQSMQQQQVQAAKFGAKLNYLRQLKGQCPDGYEMQYYKSGGQLCKKCIKKSVSGGAVNTPMDSPASQFKAVTAKCGRKMKKKAACGTKMPIEKCGGKPKLKKKACGGRVKKNEGGSQMNPTNQGRRVTLKRETRTVEPYEEIITKYWTDGTKSRMETSEDGTTYIGRRGEVGITNVPNYRQNAIADSLRRIDWSGKTVPSLKLRNRK